jgi:hypothetical protein
MARFDHNQTKLESVIKTITSAARLRREPVIIPRTSLDAAYKKVKEEQKKAQFYAKLSAVLAILCLTLLYKVLI